MGFLWDVSGREWRSLHPPNFAYFRYWNWDMFPSWEGPEAVVTFWMGDRTTTIVSAQCFFLPLILEILKSWGISFESVWFLFLDLRWNFLLKNLHSCRKLWISWSLQGLTYMGQRNVNAPWNYSPCTFEWLSETLPLCRQGLSMTLCLLAGGW